MPLKMELVFEKGWKETERSRFGFVLVIRFIDVETKKVMFKYAPTLEDREFFAHSFNAILSVDDLHKEYINKIMSMGIEFSSEVKNELKKCG